MSPKTGSENGLLDSGTRVAQHKDNAGSCATLRTPNTPTWANAPEIVAQLPKSQKVVPLSYTPEIPCNYNPKHHYLTYESGTTFRTYTTCATLKNPANTTKTQKIVAQVAQLSGITPYPAHIHTWTHNGKLCHLCHSGGNQ